MSMQSHNLVHPDIKPENPPERAAHYLDVPNMPWEATKFSRHQDQGALYR
jgi:hypothetical protein